MAPPDVMCVYQQVTWVQLYDAVIAGDGATVMAAVRQGMRCQRPLVANHSALDILAFKGHVTILKDVLRLEPDSLDKLTDCITALQSAIDGNQPLTFIYLCAIIRDLFKTVNMAATDQYRLTIRFQKMTGYCTKVCRSVGMIETMQDMVKLISDTIATIAPTYSLLPDVFENGHKDMLKQHLKLLGAKEWPTVAKTLHVPEYFIELFMKPSDVKRILDRNPGWSNPNSNGLHLSLSCFLARFGLVRLLKLVIRLRRESADGPLSGTEVRACRSEALRFGHEPVLELLTSTYPDTKLASFSYKALVHSPWSLYAKEMYSVSKSNAWMGNPFGQDIKLLLDRTHIIGEKQSSLLEQDRILRLLHESVTWKSKSKKRCLNAKPWLLKAIQKGLTGVVQRLIGQVEWDCIRGDDGHACLRAALGDCQLRSEQKFALPPVVQLVLDKSARGSGCVCGEVTYWDTYLEWPKKTRHGDYSWFDEKHTLEYCISRTHELYQLLFNHGAIVRRTQIKRVINRYFCVSKETLNYLGARVICFFEWIDLCDILSVELSSSAWFEEYYPDRDVFITHILRSVCGTKQSQLRWKSLLKYIVGSGSRFDLYDELIKSLGISLRDVADRNFKPLEFQRATELVAPKMLSLQELSRVKLYEILRERSTRLLYAGVYAPVPLILKQLVLDCHLPVNLMDFLQFRDLCTKNGRDLFTCPAPRPTSRSSSPLLFD